MNHLKTSKERKARWYSKQKPRYLHVRPGKNWNEVFCHGMDGSDNDCVLSIPINWLMMKEKLPDNQKSDNGDSKTGKKGTNIGKFAATNPARATTQNDGSSRRTTTTIKTNFLNEILEKHGFAVISGVLSKSDCQSALEKAWDYIEVASFAEQQYQELQQTNKTSTSSIDNNDDNIPVESSRKKKKNKQENHNLMLHTSRDVTMISPVQRHDPNTHWSPYFPRCVEGGMLPFYGSGHSTFAWFIRSHPNVRRVFETFYAKDKRSCSHDNDDDDDDSSSYSAAMGGSVLLSSLDGIVLWRSPPSSPSSLTSSKRILCATTNNNKSPRDDGEDCHNGSKQDYSTDAGWFHIDQNPRTKPEKAAIQGLVNLLPVTPKTGGNVVVTQSHHYFPHHYNSNDDDETSISKTFKTKINDSTIDKGVSGKSQVLSSSPIDQQQYKQACKEFYRVRLDELEGDDWMEIDPQDTSILQPNHIIACLLEPGDMILWDSRTVHCSYPRDSTAQSSEAADIKAVDTSSDLSMPSSFGLLRAGAAVSMMPMQMISQSVLLERRRAVDQSRTLTHWVDKAAPLGEEKSDQVAMEDKCVLFVKQYQRDILTGSKVLLEYEDLSEEQKQMVAGSLA